MADDDDTSKETAPVVDPPADSDSNKDSTTENKPDITPDTTPDVSVYIAKISELEGIIAVKDSEIAGLNTALTVSKAANYDLLMGMPKEDETDTVIDPPADETANGGIDSLFGKKEN